MTVTEMTRPTTVQNWPIQSLGAEMLRVAIDMMQEQGIRVCAPVHDAVVIEAPLQELDETICAAKRLMRQASRAVLRGVIDCRVDAEVVRWPNRYMDDRPAAKEMWNRVMQLLGTTDKRVA